MSARPAHRAASPTSRFRHPTWWWILSALVVLLYAGLTLAIIFHTSLVNWDADLARLDLRHTHPAWRGFVYYYVMFGQRGPATLAFLPFFFWAAYRERSSRPLVMLVVALILLNLSVGIVKIITGRLGPRDTEDVHAVFRSGNIYPSGHVSNAVVLYGLIAMLVLSHRVLIATWAVVLSVTVGLGTVYLNTHWLSDVIGGWFAGALVLLAMPVVTPFSQRVVDAAIRRMRRRRTQALAQAHPPDPRPVPQVRSTRIISAPEFGSVTPPNESITPVGSDSWSRR